MAHELKGVQVFDEGRWNSIEFTSADLDGIAASFDALNLAGKVPLKFGHAGKDARHDDTQPALGWVERVYRKGTKLLADFADVPDEVFQKLKSRAYKFVSVELLRNVPAGNRRIPWVLDAVALLGATAPAVGTLSPIALRRVDLAGERHSFSTHRPQEAKHRMDEALDYLDSQIRAGRILPRDREAFSRRYGEDGTLDDAKAWVRATPQEQQRGRAASSSRSVAGDQPDAQVLELAKEEQRRARREDGVELSLTDAALVVMRRESELGKAWVFQTDAFYARRK